MSVRRCCVGALLALGFAATGAVAGESAPPRERAAPPAYQEGPGLALVSWYGGDAAGRRTANGERFDPQAMTAAHRSLPFGTLLEVSDPVSGRRVLVRINDRGPYAPAARPAVAHQDGGGAVRELDLSQAAAQALGLLRAGVARLKVRVAAICPRDRMCGPALNPPPVQVAELAPSP